MVLITATEVQLMHPLFVPLVIPIKWLPLFSSLSLHFYFSLHLFRLDAYLINFELSSNVDI